MTPRRRDVTMSTKGHQGEAQPQPLNPGHVDGCDRKNDTPRICAVFRASDEQLNSARRLRETMLEAWRQPRGDDLGRAAQAARLGCMRADFVEAMRLRALAAWDAVAERAGVGR